MNRKNQNLVVGSFVLVALAILLFGIYFLKETVPGKRQDRYYAVFDQVSTLQEGDPIKVNGVKMGKVEGIRLEGHRVKVGLSLDRGIKLTRDSEVRIQNIGLMGERQIGIRLGTSTDTLAPGAVLEGLLDAGIAEAMGVAGEVMVQAEGLVRDLRAALDSTVAKPEFAMRFNRLLDTTEALTRNLSGLMRETEPKLTRALDRIEKAGSSVQGLVEEQREPLRHIMSEGKKASERLSGLTDRADKVAADMQSLIQQINSDQGTVGALLRDTTLHRELNRTLGSADSLFRLIHRKGLDVNLNLF